MRSIRTDKARSDFLDELAQGNSVTAACRAANISRVAAYEWRADDEDFARDWEQAIDAGTETMEDEAKRRATHGVKVAVYHNGVVVGYEVKHSDTLMMFLLKGRKPGTYRDNSTVKMEGGLLLDADKVSDTLAAALVAAAGAASKYKPAEIEADSSGTGAIDDDA